jgi:hypothetical protein
MEAYYVQRTRFDSIAERKLRLRQLTEDGNVEISGRDLRQMSVAEVHRPPLTAAVDPLRPFAFGLTATAADADLRPLPEAASGRSEGI